MTVYAGGEDLGKILVSNGKPRTLDEVQQDFLRVTKLTRKELSGQALLVFNELDSILEELRTGVSEKPDYERMYERCVKAYAAKVKWHLDYNGAVPYAFGKIVDYQLQEDKRTNTWTGMINLCTWIGSVNYYFEIEFLKADPNSMRLVKDPFTGTLDPTLFPMAEFIQNFDYKLHAKPGSIDYQTIIRNNVLLPQGDALYASLEEDCFDTFYVERPDGTQSHDLAEQLGYCMGRCDARVVNTGR